jgi:hypothetical protein
VILGRGGRMLKVAIHDHPSGPHAFKHLQVNTWRRGVRGSGRTIWRSKEGWLR